MTQYINKAAVVAEIERRVKSLNKDRDFNYLQIKELEALLSSLNTLEVKEVDLKKALESWRHNHFHGRRDKDASGEYLERDSQLDLAKHFFELGLKSKSPYVGIPNIDDTLKEMGVDPDSKSAESFREFYYMALEKFKAQKGEIIMTSEELTHTISAILHGKDIDTTMRFKDGRIIQREIVNGKDITINEIDITKDVANAISQYINKEK